MIGAVLDRVVPWQMRRLRFSEQRGPDAAARTSEAFESFLCGARPALVRADPQVIREAELTVPWHRRAFFWEGQAFGAAARHAVGLRGGNLADRYFAPGYRFMFYTGLGVWNGMAPGYLLPRVSLDPGRWAQVPDFVAFRQFVAGGISFSAVVGSRRLDGSTLTRLDPGTDPYWRRGLAQGMGRAAWFLYMGDLPRLSRVLDELDEVGVAEGLGVAITYTQLDRPDRILEGVEGLPDRWLPSVRNGIRAGLGALAADDPRLVGHLEGLPAPLDQWLAQGVGVLAEAARGDDMPQRMDRALAALDA